VREGLEAIVASLNAGTAIMALASAVYHGVAPRDAAYPYLTVDYVPPGSPVPFFEGGWESHVFQVKAVDRDTDATTALQLQGLIVARLVRANVSVAGRSLISVRTEGLIEYQEVDGDDVYWHAGAEIRIGYA
jgi:hypothetical protein